jgi:hypothetical protein
LRDFAPVVRIKHSNTVRVLQFGFQYNVSRNLFSDGESCLVIYKMASINPYLHDLIVLPNIMFNVLKTGRVYPVLFSTFDQPVFIFLYSGKEKPKK